MSLFLTSEMSLFSQFCQFCQFCQFKPAHKPLFANKSNNFTKFTTFQTPRNVPLLDTTKCTTFRHRFRPVLTFQFPIPVLGQGTSKEWQIPENSVKQWYLVVFRHFWQNPYPNQGLLAKLVRNHPPDTTGPSSGENVKVQQEPLSPPGASSKISHKFSKIMTFWSLSQVSGFSVTFS